MCELVDIALCKNGWKSKAHIKKSIITFPLCTVLNMQNCGL